VIDSLRPLVDLADRWCSGASVRPIWAVPAGLEARPDLMVTVKL